MPRKPLKCPECDKGHLKQHKNPYTSGRGFVYRTRKCVKCEAVVHTKQPPEEITEVEK